MQNGEVRIEKPGRQSILNSTFFILNSRQVPIPAEQFWKMRGRASAAYKLTLCSRTLIYLDEGFLLPAEV
jgi:hypothetical protein